MAAACLGRAPEPFKGESADFPDWLIEFEDYLSVVEITNGALTDVQKLALLKNCIGSASRKIMDGFTLPTVT